MKKLVDLDYKRKVLFASRYVKDDGVLPDFVMVGTPKSGTTSLYDYLTQHKQIVPALRKEVFYFNREGQGNLDKGERWYRAHFVSKAFLDKKNAITGEGSPYMYYDEAIEAIQSLLPKKQFIMVLRNPIERLYSHYQMGVRSGRQKRSFDEVLQQLYKDGLDNCKVMWINQSYYLPYVQKWFEAFPNREQTLILKSEDLFKNTQSVFNQTCDFLSLPHQKINVAPSNLGGYKEKMSQETRNKLQDIYKKPNQELEAFLGMKFNW